MHSHIDYQYCEFLKNQPENLFLKQAIKFSSIHFEGSAPPAYSVEYQDPSEMHPDKAPIFENPSYALPNELGVNNNAYTGLPGKE